MPHIPWVGVYRRVEDVVANKSFFIFLCIVQFLSQLFIEILVAQIDQTLDVCRGGEYAVLNLGSVGSLVIIKLVYIICK